MFLSIYIFCRFLCQSEMSMDKLPVNHNKSVMSNLHQNTTRQQTQVITMQFEHLGVCGKLNSNNRAPSSADCVSNHTQMNLDLIYSLAHVNSSVLFLCDSPLGLNPQVFCKPQAPPTDFAWRDNSCMPLLCLVWLLLLLL